MTTAQLVETLVTVNNNISIQECVHPDDHTQPIYETFYYWYNLVVNCHCVTEITSKETRTIPDRLAFTDVTCFILLSN